MGHGEVQSHGESGGSERGNESSRDDKVVISWLLKMCWRHAAFQWSADDLTQCVCMCSSIWERMR